MSPIPEPTTTTTERLDLDGLPCDGVSMASVLEGMAARGKRSLVIVGDSVVENMFYSLLCDVLRTAPTAALAAQLSAMLRDTQKKRHVEKKASSSNHAPPTHVQVRKNPGFFNGV